MNIVFLKHSCVAHDSRQ